MSAQPKLSFALIACIAASLSACDNAKKDQASDTTAAAKATATATAAPTAKAETVKLGPGFDKCTAKIEASAIPDKPLAGTFMNTHWKFGGGFVQARGDSISFSLFDSPRSKPCMPFPKDNAKKDHPKISATVKGKLEKKTYIYNKDKHADFYAGYTHYEKGTPNSGNLHGVSVLVIDSIENKKEGKVTGRAYFCGNKDEGFAAGTFEIANCTVK